jgi:hypothetical protein
MALWSRASDEAWLFLQAHRGPLFSSTLNKAFNHQKRLNKQNGGKYELYESEVIVKEENSYRQAQDRCGEECDLPDKERPDKPFLIDHHY